MKLEKFINKLDNGEIKDLKPYIEKENVDILLEIAKRGGVRIQYCEYDEDAQELVEHVGVKYSTEQTIESPLILHATIQELLERIKKAKN